MDINNFLSKIFGNKATRDMKAIQPYVDKVKEIYPTFAALSNDELRAKTKEIQTKVQHSADDLKEKIADLKNVHLCAVFRIMRWIYIFLV